MSFFFGEFELDTGTYKLRRGDAEIPLQPKVFDAIRYLVENRDRVVRKEEILDALWPGEHVNDTAVPWTISRARKVLGQDADSNFPIETIRGRGYRFTAEVRQTRQSEPAPPSASRLSVTPATPARARLTNDPFVGRGDAMERLVGALHEASAGRGRLVLLTGEAGMGKTRCLNEFGLIARGLNMGVWTGRCLEGGRGAAFWPWVQVVRDALAEGALGPSLAAEGQALLDELIPRADLDHHTDVAASSAVAARFWVLEKLSRFLLKCAEASPRVVFLDDMHWADEASIDLLIFLGAELSHGELLVVATARDAVLHPSDTWAKALARLGPCERVELSGLEAKEVATYVSEVTGMDLAADIQSAVYAKCGGNPLFLQETARLLTALADRNGVSSLRPDDVTVPGVARDVLRARLTGLPPETCEALEIACVIGQEFDVPVLQAALGVDAKTLLLHLDEAARARLIAARRRAGTYGFVHDTIRAALYEELPTARRIELHDRVARALEGRPRGDFSINELAYHSYRALPRAEPARVERYAREAAESAMGSFAYEEASEFFTWALEAQRFRVEADPRNHCELLLAFATALRLSGQVRDAHRTIARAIEIARQNRFADLLSEAARKLRPSAAIALVADPLALQALEEASALVTDDQRPLRIRILAQLACVPPYSLSIAKSQELSARAVGLAREGNDAADLVEALRSRLHALSGPDSIDALLEVADEISRLEPYATSNQRGEAEVARFHALIHKGDMHAAERALEDIGRVGRALHRPETLWHYERDRATLAFQAGHFDEAQAAFHDLFAQGRRLRLPYGKFFFMTHILVLAYERTGFGILQNSAGEWRTHLDWASSLPSYQAHEIRFLFEMGRVDEARMAFDAMARGGFENITRELGYLNALAQLSLVAVGLEDEARAETLYELLAPYPHHNTPTNFGFYQGSVSYFLGRLASLLGRSREAGRHLEDALAMNTRLGCVPQIARTQLALAGALTTDVGRGGRARATELVGEATATARRLQMAPLLEQIERFRAEQASPATRLRAR